MYTIPPGLRSDGLMKSLLENHQALSKRLGGAGDFRANSKYEYHEGVPDFNNLPKADFSVWLQLANVRQDQQAAPFGAEAFVATWRIEIVLRDGGNDPHGFSQEAILLSCSDVLDVLTKTSDDTSLDSSVDFTGQITMNADVGRISGGDRLVADVVITFDAALPFLNCR